MSGVHTALLIGHYGFGNPGDEAILAGILQRLRLQHRDLRLIVASGAPAGTEALHQVESLAWTDMAALIEATRASDLVIMGGGGLYHDYWPFDPASLLTQHHSGLAFFCGMSFLAQAMRKPVLMYAVGVGPLGTAHGQAITRAAMHYASLIAVRDDYSRRQLLDMGIEPARITVAPDPALSLEAAPVERTRSRPVLGVALRNWTLGTSQPYWERQVASALDVVVEHLNAEVAFIPFWNTTDGSDGDSDVALRIHGHMHHGEHASMVAPEGDYRATFRAIADCDWVLGMRLHACIFGANAGLPVVGLSYDPKVRSVMEAIGLGDFAIELASITSGRLAEALLLAFERRDLIRKHLIEQRSAISERSSGLAQRVVGLLLDRPERFAKDEPANYQNDALINLARQLYAEGGRAAGLQADVQVRDEAILRLQSQLNELATNSAAALVESRTAADRQVSDRDAVIADLNREMLARVSERDQMIRSLQAQLQADVESRDSVIHSLQRELHSKVAERDAAIGVLQSQLIAEIKQRQSEANGLLAELQAAQSSREAQAARLAAAQANLTAAAREHEQVKSEFAAERAKWQDQEQQLSARIQNVSGQLKAIHTSRYWKALGYYWRAVDAVIMIRKWFAVSGRQLARRWLSPRQRRALLQSVSPPQPAPVQALAAGVTKDSADAVSNSCDIFCFGIIDWDFRYQRPQQLLTRLARRGHRVYYVRPRFGPLASGLTTRDLGERIVEITLPGDASMSPYSDPWPTEHQATACQALKAFARSVDAVDAVALAQIPFWAPLVRSLRADLGWRVIYDCMDHHAGFEVTHPQVESQEADLLALSDLVLFTSDTLRRRHPHLAHKARLLRNAADYDYFARARASHWAPELAAVQGPVIGYYGAIAEWFDFDLIRHAAAVHPNWVFALIGHTFGSDAHADLVLRHNVLFLGEKPYADLPAYLSRFDAAIIPFKDSALTRATDPVKLYEYLAAGKPVVATDLTEIRPHAHLLYLARGPQEFTAQLARALAEDNSALAPARQAMAQAHTWDARALELKSALPALFPRVSVVIVAYNNLDLTRQCLSSLARATYPNLEVIVVDNASQDGTPDFLQNLAEAGRITLIANRQNAGFAAANNQGLAHTTGKFLVLMNNDVVAPPRALSRLVRHLADPAVGLVGPVTNRTGNEAMIPTDYDTMAAMERFADARGRDLRGQAFDIPVLAFFCVAFRRDVWEKVGPLDEQFAVGMFEDDDYAQRVQRAGYRVVCAEDAFVHHYGEAAFNDLKRDRRYEQLFEANRRRYEAKWGLAWEPHKAREGA